VGDFAFWYKSAADVFNSSLTVTERLVKPYLCARLKTRRFCYTDQPIKTLPMQVERTISVILQEQQKLYLYCQQTILGYVTYAIGQVNTLTTLFKLTWRQWLNCPATGGGSLSLKLLD